VEDTLAEEEPEKELFVETEPVAPRCASGVAALAALIAEQLNASQSAGANNAQPYLLSRSLLTGMTPPLVQHVPDAFVISRKPWPSQGGKSRVVKGREGRRAGARFWTRQRNMLHQRPERPCQGTLIGRRSLIIGRCPLPHGERTRFDAAGLRFGHGRSRGPCLLPLLERAAVGVGRRSWVRGLLPSFSNSSAARRADGPARCR
jgi:hypothetical protein